MPSNKSTAGGTGISCSISALNFPLQMPKENIMADSGQTGAADVEQLVSPFRVHHSQRLVRSSMSRLLPGRDDTALDIKVAWQSG